jgi:branched-chain amino acid transport system permease protein
MIGAFVGYGVMTSFIADSEAIIAPFLIIIVMLVVSMLVCGVLGVVIEQFAYRPLRNSPRIAALISALGVSFFLQNSAQLVLSADIRSYPTPVLIPLDSHIPIEIGSTDVIIPTTRIIVVVSAVVLMVALYYLVRRTRLGAAMRAVATDREAAAMMGVDVDRVIVMTFFIGSALAGAAGVMTGIAFRRVWHYMGFISGLKGFTAAVIGGIGNIPGAMLGGFLLGLIEAFTVGFVSATYRDTIAFVVLILVLLIRPSGLLGARLPDKV